MNYPVYNPFLHGNEKKYVTECLDSRWISSKGHFVHDFEEKFSNYVSVKYATTVSNGTTALHLALVALGITVGDEVIVPTFTYVASANPIKMVGATPVFVDSLQGSWQMDPEDVRRKISDRTKAIIVVHLYGHPCEMDAIMKIANENNLLVIEDCAEAIGTKYRDKHVGTFGIVGCFSFFGNKTITCGEGGMVVCNDEQLFEKMIHLKSQGVSKEREYWHDVVAYNYRMTNLQAAIGVAQLEQISVIIEKKQKIAGWYNKYLSNLPVIFHNSISKEIEHSYWMCSILVESENVRMMLREYLKEEGIETRPTFPTIHLMPMYIVDCESVFPVAEKISKTGINLPSYPDLVECDVKYICRIIENFYKSRL